MAFVCMRVCMCMQVKVYRDAAGPRVLRQLTESVQSGLETGKFPKEAKEANEALIESFKVLGLTWRWCFLSLVFKVDVGVGGAGACSDAERFFF